MKFDREQQRTRWRQKWGDDVTFPPSANGIRPGDLVTFDHSETKIGGHIERQSREGYVVDHLERTDDHGLERVREYVIVVPAVNGLDGRVVIEERLFRRPNTAVTLAQRHGGPGHDAAA